MSRNDVRLARVLAADAQRKLYAKSTPSPNDVAWANAAAQVALAYLAVARDEETLEPFSAIEEA